jgi:glycosyltransferase involved in cell wall biosynthesis
MSHIDISVIVITKNQAWNIARLLNSVMLELASLPQAEVIVVDSASTDDTVLIAESYPSARLLRLPGDQRLTPAAGRYAGFHHSKGEWIVHLDGDTELVTGWIPDAIEMLKKDPRLAGITGQLCRILEGEPSPLIPVPSSEFDLWDCRYLPGGASIYRRSALEQVGSFDPWLYSEEEAELALRLRNAGYRLVQNNRFCAIHRDLISPLTFAGAWSRYRRNLLYGQGQVFRKHFGARVFWLFLTERGWRLAPPLLVNLLFMLAVIVSVVAGSPFWIEAFLGAFLTGILLLGLTKHSLYQAAKSVFAFELLLIGTIRGFRSGVPPAERYVIDGIEMTHGAALSPAVAAGTPLQFYSTRPSTANHLNKQLILYTGNFRFPDGDAAAARVLGIGYALRAAGYEVIFGGGESGGRAEDRASAGGFVFHGFSYDPQGGIDRGGASGLRRILQVSSSAGQIARWVRSFAGRGLAAVIAYGPATPLMASLRRTTRSLEIPLLLDLTEWHTGATLPGGPLGYRNLDSQLRMRLLYPRADGIIAVSSLLERHYRAAGCEAIRIPPLVDLEDPKWKAGWRAPSEALRLMYAGNPGNKDLLGPIIRAVVAPRERARRIELHLLGPSAEEALALADCELTSTRGKGAEVICHGRMAQNEVPAVVGGMDFTVLLRRNDRNANAGFATKVVESLSSGVPVITNITSDLADFIRHGREGLIVNGTTAEAFACALEDAAALDPAALARLSEAAIQRARESFDFRNYETEIAELVERARRRIVRPIYETRLPLSSDTKRPPICPIASGRDNE